MTSERFSLLPARRDDDAAALCRLETSITLGTTTGALYVPGGNPAPDFDPNVRLGENLFTDSVVVLDAKTANYRNHLKIVAKDWHDWNVPMHGGEA
jgi:glucose dehydrogenase